MSPVMAVKPCTELTMASRRVGRPWSLSLISVMEAVAWAEVYPRFSMTRG